MKDFKQLLQFNLMLFCSHFLIGQIKNNVKILTEYPKVALLNNPSIEDRFGDDDDLSSVRNGDYRFYLFNHQPVMISAR